MRLLNVVRALGASVLVLHPSLAFSDDSAAKPAASAGAGAVTNVIENSVVKVFATVRYPDYFKPWTKESPTELTSSGVVIEGKRILCNAHGVLYASQVQVQANQSGDKVSATVVAIAPEIDLAVLKLDDETFFDTHAPVPRARALPSIKDVVLAYGYPKGGTSLSITKGIVSRIDFAPYNLGTSGLRIQIDAAINPGNSGGPAVVGDKMIGLAFSHLASSENIGYIIPCEEIDLFLDDVADGRYDGKPALFDEFQEFENPALRAYLKADAAVKGIIVCRPGNIVPDYPLQASDLITHIGETPIDDEGMVPIGGNLRVFFSYMVQRIATNGTVPLTVWRGGKELHLQVPVPAKEPHLIPDVAGSYPSFFVYGPLVFSGASVAFVTGGNSDSVNGRRWMAALTAVGSPLIRRLGDRPAFDGEGLVVVSSPFFPHKLSKGYGSPMGEVVKSVNGMEIKNLDHLVAVLRDCKDEFVRFEFGEHHSEALVFPRNKMDAATDEILNDNGIRTQGSPDTMAVWNGQKDAK